MDGRKIYSFEELIAMDAEEIAELVLTLQNEAAQSLFALEDTTRRYSEQAQEKDARIARLEEENAAISKENEILKAALGDRKAIMARNRRTQKMAPGQFRKKKGWLCCPAPVKWAGRSRMQEKVPKQVDMAVV